MTFVYASSTYSSSDVASEWWKKMMGRLNWAAGIIGALTWSLPGYYDVVCGFSLVASLAVLCIPVLSRQRVLLNVSKTSPQAELGGTLFLLLAGLLFLLLGESQILDFNRFLFVTSGIVLLSAILIYRYVCGKEALVNRTAVAVFVAILLSTCLVRYVNSAFRAPTRTRMAGVVVNKIKKKGDYINGTLRLETGTQVKNITDFTVLWHVFNKYKIDDTVVVQIFDGRLGIPYEETN